MKKPLLILFLLMFFIMGYSDSIFGIKAEIIQPVGIEIVQDVMRIEEEINQFQTVFQVTSNSHYSYQFSGNGLFNLEENIAVKKQNDLFNLIIVDFTFNTEEKNLIDQYLYEVELMVTFE